MGMHQPEKVNHRDWHYKVSGDYHRNLDMNWSYAPTYLQKQKLVEQFINTLPQSSKILDAGCGEGVFVEKFVQEGWNIKGIDFNYESDLVERGDIRNLQFPDRSFDVVLLLDVLEHLAFADQPQALAEIYRTLTDGGYLFLAVPNLAHLNCRVRLMVLGELDRTDNEINHLGERPIGENAKLITQANFRIESCKGITVTLPIIYRRVICRKPAQFRWLHDCLEPVARQLPSLAMLTIFVCRKGV